jgi:hypothetical protein
MSESDGAKVTRIPIVLTLDCTPALLGRCRAIAAKRRLLVRPCESASAWQTAVRLQPLAIVVPSHVHERAPKQFELLASEASARLVVLESDQLPAHELEWHLTSAVHEAARAREA